MSFRTFYDSSLNRDPLKLTVGTIDDVADWIIKQERGSLRMIAALARAHARRGLPHDEQYVPILTDFNRQMHERLNLPLPDEEE